MKLELKHLAPYLPYGLQFCPKNEPETILFVDYIYFKRRNRVNVLPPVKRTSVGTFEHVKADWMLNEIKLFLRPLSDLTKEITVNGQKIIPINTSVFDKHDKIRLNKVLKSSRGSSAIKELPHYIVTSLMFWHIDVFGLIDKGLAVDINMI